MCVCVYVCVSTTACLNLYLPLSLPLSLSLSPSLCRELRVLSIGRFRDDQSCLQLWFGASLVLDMILVWAPASMHEVMQELVSLREVVPLLKQLIRA